MSRLKLTIVALLAGIGTTISAQADMNSDKAAIKERLVRWTEAFNARNVAEVCVMLSLGLRKARAGNSVGCDCRSIEKMPFGLRICSVRCR